METQLVGYSHMLSSARQQCIIPSLPPIFILCPINLIITYLRISRESALWPSDLWTSKYCLRWELVGKDSEVGTELASSTHLLAILPSNLPDASLHINAEQTADHDPRIRGSFVSACVSVSGL